VLSIGASWRNRLSRHREVSWSLCFRRFRSPMSALDFKFDGLSDITTTDHILVRRRSLACALS
jgi:hypothetical protein